MSAVVQHARLLVVKEIESLHVMAETVLDRLRHVELELRDLRDWPDGHGPSQARDPYDNAANLSVEAAALCDELERKLRRMVKRLA
jgi:hypothetical protein